MGIKGIIFRMAVPKCVGMDAMPCPSVDIEWTNRPPFLRVPFFFDVELADVLREDVFFLDVRDAEFFFVAIICKDSRLLKRNREKSVRILTLCYTSDASERKFTNPSLFNITSSSLTIASSSSPPSIISVKVACFFSTMAKR